MARACVSYSLTQARRVMPNYLPTFSSAELENQFNEFLNSSCKNLELFRPDRFDIFHWFLNTQTECLLSHCLLCPFEHFSKLCSACNREEFLKLSKFCFWPSDEFDFLFCHFDPFQCLKISANNHRFFFNSMLSIIDMNHELSTGWTKPRVTAKFFVFELQTALGTTVDLNTQFFFLIHKSSLPLLNFKIIPSWCESARKNRNI